MEIAHVDVDVDVLVGDVQITHRLQRDRRERLVDLEQVHIGRGPALPPQRLEDRVGRLAQQRRVRARDNAVPPISHPGFAAVFATAGYHRPSSASGGGIGSGSSVNSPTSPPLIRYGRRPSSCLFRCEAAAVGGTPWGAGQASYSNAASGPCGPGARLHARPAFAQPEQSRRRCRTSSPCRTLKMFVPLTFSPGWFYRGPSS
jgi:hypothetical protein